MLAVTIQNTATEPVPFPLPDLVDGSADDCVSHPVRDTQMFGIAGIDSRFAATFRGHESIPVPTIEPGFTSDYSVLWAVSAAELRRHPQIAIRIYKMYSSVSTFVAAHSWSGDADRYAELRIPNLAFELRAGGRTFP